MSLFFIPNDKWGLAAYLDVYKQNGLKSEEKNCVFIFPGNASHHTKSTTLFSVKVGAGLAKVATDIGNAGYPTLSLPTTSMEMWESDKTQQATVQGAIQDLYRAVGAGYHLILPVREYTKKSHYFDKPLKSAPGEAQYEPSFWGGVQTGANKPLANYYIECLNNLQEFINLSEDERKEKLDKEPNNVFYQAYKQGSSWFQKNSSTSTAPNVKPASSSTAKAKPTSSPAAETKPTPPPKPESVKEPKNIPKVTRPSISKETYADYEKIYSNKLPVNGIRDLLNDYTKNNSALWRFFTLHWNRNHVALVNKLVSDIDKKVVVDIDIVFDRLNEIVLHNPNGSLARRIDFLKQKNGILPLTNNDYYRPL